MTIKFCTSCQSTRDLESGVFRQTRVGKRWMCALCAAHKAPSIYANKTGQIADVKKIMDKLYRKATQ